MPMDQSPNLKLPYIAAAQAQKHITHNEAIRALDALVQLAVKDRDLATPPPSPAEGDQYIIAANATGDWAGHDLEVTAFQDGTWMFYAPMVGWTSWVEDETQSVAWNGSTWTDTGGGSASVNPTPLVGVNATADTTNRLSVNSQAVLLNHEGSGHQLKINKNTAGDTASLLFQTGFSGRAEFGTTGDDDFHVKVSPDGSTFHEALIVDKDTGEVTFPNTSLGSSNQVSTVAQTLTDTQKQQARRNIYAAPFDAMAYHGLQVNGCLEISQEHGNNAVQNGNHPVDQEYLAEDGPTVTGKQVISPFPSRPDIPYGIECEATTGAGLGATDFMFIVQNIEGKRIQRLGLGTSVSSPFRIGRVVRSNVSGRGYVSVRNGAADLSYLTHFDLVANTDTYVDVTIPGTAAGTWASNNTRGLYLAWCFGSGPTFGSGIDETWQSGNHISASDVTNFFSATGNKVWLGPMVVLPGNDLPTFEEIMKCQRHFDDELRSCQRYYVREQQAGVYTNDTINSTNGFQISFPVTMRTTPSIAYYAGQMINHHTSPPNGTVTTLTTGCNSFWSGASYRSFTGTAWVEYGANARM